MNYQMDYFYGHEANQFTFFRIPKLLFWYINIVLEVFNMPGVQIEFQERVAGKIYQIAKIINFFI